MNRGKAGGGLAPARATRVEPAQLPLRVPAEVGTRLLRRERHRAAAAGGTRPAQRAAGDAAEWSGGVSILFLRPERDGDGPTGAIAPPVNPRPRTLSRIDCAGGRIGAGSPCFGAILGSASSSRSPSRPLSACWCASSSRSAAPIRASSSPPTSASFRLRSRPARPASNTATGSWPWTAARPFH